MSLNTNQEQSYNRILEELYKLRTHGVKLGLGRIKKLLSLMGNPQKEFETILVAGTNGKGSTCAMLASILFEHGQRVGLYTSPHLEEFNERIVVNREKIPREKVLLGLREILNHSKHLEEEGYGHPTFFEVTTTLAFWYFNKMEVDLAVLEVGLGGRLDATNVVNPVVSVITNIGIDHREQLGDTIEKIAREKAGIIKPGSSVVCSAQDSHAQTIVRKTCEEKGCSLVVVGEDVWYEPLGHNITRQTFNYHGLNNTYKGLEIPLIGEHQLLNAATALATLELLEKRVIAKIDPTLVRKGLLGTKWPGRLEKVGEKPLVMLDCAHNPQAAKHLAETIKKLKLSGSHDKLILVFGVLRDKDVAGILQTLTPIADKIVLTKPNTDRAVEPEEILSTITKKHRLKNIETVVAKGVGEALNKAFETANFDSLILVTGSVYLVGEARAKLLNHPKPETNLGDPLISL